MAFGVFTQLAALAMILIMPGAIQKKIFVWHIGFWGEKTYGWHYDLMFIVMNLVILFTDGGRRVLMKQKRERHNYCSPPLGPSLIVQSVRA